MQFLEARWFTKGQGRVIDLLVIHDMEMPEKGDTAESCARFFQRGTSRASAHYCIDNDSIVQCVKDEDIAWAAPGANHQGLHFEHAGYANQTAADWSDAYSQQMLSVSAVLVSQKCVQYQLPMAFVNAAGLSKGYRGITTHWEITKAFKTAGGHTDPGPNFPMADYIKMVQNASRDVGAIHQEMRPVANAPIVTIIVDVKGRGYWIVTEDGGVFSEGDVPFFGSLGGTTLAAPIVDAAPTPTGEGYILVARDGGVFAFGDAQYRGSVEYKG